MYNTIIIRNGEISIKGQNRIDFEKKLQKNIKRALIGLEGYKVHRGDGRIYVDVTPDNLLEILFRLKNVFGVVSFSPAIRTQEGYDALREACLLLSEFLASEKLIHTFKVDIKRQNKKFPLKSPDMSREIGGYILAKNTHGLTAKMIKPDLMLQGELREHCNIIYGEKMAGMAGLPVGINGKAMVLLSGGIDSPVAAFLSAKRGLYIEAVHFHSFPFTSEKSRQKVEELSKILARYTENFKIHTVNLLPAQQNISEKCPESLMTILSRRFMMRIAEVLAERNHCNCLVTGESIGQVASQTVEGLTATNHAVKTLPVFRPLISMDKEEIIEWSKRLGTFEISILPEEDCCTVFLPKHPSTKPSLEKVLHAESLLDTKDLMSTCLATEEILEVGL